MATETTETTEPNPTPKTTFFPFTQPNFFGGLGDTNFWVGLRGSVDSVDSVAIQPPTTTPPGAVWRGRLTPHYLPAPVT